jgi:hypothetical protein
MLYGILAVLIGLAAVFLGKKMKSFNEKQMQQYEERKRKKAEEKAKE